MDSALQDFRDRRNAKKADGIPVAKKDTLKAPSRKNNNRMQAVWDNYKAKNPDADLQDGETLIEFVWDYARHSKGKISDRSSIHTLDQYILRFAGMMKVDHGIKIPEKNIEDARQFFKGDLKEELSLSDSQYDKGFADWEDIKIIIKHGLAYDEHQYHDERHRLQLIFLFLLISDDGERIGAIARSDCYREEERALTYNDTKLFLLPESEVTRGSRFKLVIKFCLRKNERDDPDNFLIVPYFLRPDHAHCIVTFFLALAILDNAFEGITTPANLLKLRNHTPCDMPIELKQSMIAIPILRRLSGRGSSQLSTYLPSSSTSMTDQAQRWVFLAGFFQRFTFYFCRRAVNNALTDGNVPDSRRDQLMGHNGPTSKVFNANYRSKILTTDSGNIFRNEAPREERAKMLCMRNQRDPMAPTKPLPADMERIYDNNEEIQALLSLRHATKELSGAEKADIRRKLSRRKESLKKKETRRLREAFIQERSANWIHSQLHQEEATVSTEEVTTSQETNPHVIQRAYLVDCLYLQSASEGDPLLLALNALILHCTGDRSLRSAQRTGNGTFQPGDDKLLSSLTNNSSLPLTWKQIQLYFPSRSESSLCNRKLNEGKGLKRCSFKCCKFEKRGCKRYTTQEDLHLLKSRRNSNKRWEDIALDMVDRNRAAIQNRYYSLVKHGMTIETLEREIYDSQNPNSHGPQDESHISDIPTNPNSQKEPRGIQSKSQTGTTMVTSKLSLHETEFDNTNCFNPYSTDLFLFTANTAMDGVNCHITDESGPELDNSATPFSQGAQLNTLNFPSLHSTTPTAMQHSDFSDEFTTDTAIDRLEFDSSPESLSYSNTTSIMDTQEVRINTPPATDLAQFEFYSSQEPGPADSSMFNYELFQENTMCLSKLVVNNYQGCNVKLTDGSKSLPSPDVGVYSSQEPFLVAAGGFRCALCAKDESASQYDVQKIWESKTRLLRHQMQEFHTPYRRWIRGLRNNQPEGVCEFKCPYPDCPKGEEYLFGSIHDLSAHVKSAAKSPKLHKSIIHNLTIRAEGWSEPDSFTSKMPDEQKKREAAIRHPKNQSRSRNFLLTEAGNKLGNKRKIGSDDRDSMGEPSAKKACI